MDGIRYWIETEGTGHWFFIAFPVVLFCLFIWFTGRRVRFLVPSLLISLVIINPWFYRVWDKLGLYAYWRILWLVPLIPVLASIIPSITESIKKSWLKTIVTTAGIGLIVFGGTFLYNGAGGSFIEVANASKLPIYVVQIADRLLSLDEHPRVIAQEPIGVYIRQYSANIDSLFGRDINGYIAIPSIEARTTIKQLRNNEMEKVAQFMLDEDYDYLVCTGELDGHFECVDTVGGYNIFRPVGIATMIKTRNDLGQVISVTTVNEEQKPVINEYGYSTIIYRYDDQGRIIYEFFTDALGNGVCDASGKAGFEQIYDNKDRVIMYRTLDGDGQPVSLDSGYAEYRREYLGNNLVSESYYDETGEPVNCVYGYEQEEWKYDKAGNMVLHRFLDDKYELVNSELGYAEKRIELNNQNRITKIEYYGPNGMLSKQTAGYAVCTRNYDKAGVLHEINYYDEIGNPINRIDGYSKATWEPSALGVKSIRFYDVDKNQVDYDNLNLVFDYETDFNGWSEWMIPQTDTINRCFNITSVNLGEREIGDTYTCQIEIQFFGVSATEGQKFWFSTQGESDGSWNAKNVWNSSFIGIGEVPVDGKYKFSYTCTIDEKMMNVESFTVGFRCDYWASGAFRVRNIKIEKGNSASHWSNGI